MVTADSIKEYGYLGDESYQPGVMSMCIDAAKEWLANADVRERVSPLYDLAVSMLAMHWYDHRAVMAIGAQPTEIEHGLQSIIHQLANGGTP